MLKLKGFLTRIGRTFRSRKFEHEMAEEMQFHVEAETELRVARGEDPVTASRRAKAMFGSIDARTEEVRERRLLAAWDSVGQDMRFALRMMQKSPGFTLVAVITLALGIGANTAIFSAVDAVLLRPLPYPDPDRLISVHETGANRNRNSVSGAAYKDWRDYQTHFEATTIYTNDYFDLTGFNQPEKISTLSVSHEFGEVFGLSPLRGRDFVLADEVVGGQNNVVILTELFWHTRFGGEDSAIGKTLTIDGTPFEIIGVYPSQIWHQTNVEIFIPHVLAVGTYQASHHVHRGSVIGRLKTGASLEAAVAELNAVKQDRNDTYPDFKQNWGVGARPFQLALAERSGPFLLILLGAVSLVLMIACANVANLLLARTNARQREIALRSALGASGNRIMRQVITESLILALLGGLVGIIFAELGLNLFTHLSSGMLPATMPPQLDLRVLTFSLIASCGTGLIFGIIPAWKSQRTDLNQALKSNSGGTTDGSRNRSQSTLIIAEVALTTVLLIGTGFLVKDMVRTVTTAPGFNPNNVLMFDLTPPYSGRYNEPNARMQFLDQVRAEIEAVPGVIKVATADDLPFGNDGQGYYYSLEEEPETRTDRTGRIKYVSQNYFETLGGNIVKGRSILPQDNTTGAAKVMVINQVMAQTLFAADEDPIGRLINANNEPWEIVGIAADMRIDNLHSEPSATFFVPHWEFPWYSTFMVRTVGDPSALTKSISAAVHRFDPNLPLDQLQPLAQAMADSLGPQKLMLRLIGAFASTALLLACIGFYGVMSYAVVNRRRELSIRMALGAAGNDLIRLVIGGGARLLGWGLLVGLVLSALATFGLNSHLPNINKLDPLIVLTTVMTLAGVTVGACWFPARRATRANPIEALRAE